MNGAENVKLRAEADGTVLAVKVVPGASRDRVVGVLGDCLKVATSAAAEKGKANAAVTRTLAAALGVDRRDVVLVAGQTNPRKEFLIRGAAPEEMRRRLEDA
jgi:uncharacterized protein